MSKHIMCDICKNEIRYTPFYKFKRPQLVKIERWMQENSIDVCEDCWNKFRKFMREEKND